MNTEEHDDLWRLLGKAKAPAVSAFFSRNVLRAIREAAPEKRGVLGTSNIKWNFTKFLIARAGNVVARSGSLTKPEQIKYAIEKLL